MKLTELTKRRLAIAIANQGSADELATAIESGGGGGVGGSTVLSGTGAPSSTLGNDGDFYIDTAAYTIYGPKASGAWGSATNLVGPQGAQGLAGSSGVVAASAPLVYDAPSQTVSIPKSDATHDGYLAQADFGTFNAKQPAGNYITALTGDIVASGPGSAAAVLTTPVHKRYVDFISGDDVNGTGSLTKPWKTIQHAYDSISPTINEPYAVYLSGGNNDTDPNPITAKPNVSLISDYGIQISKPFTISGGTTNDGATFVNIIFVGAFTWIRNDFSSLGITFINCEFFNGPILKQTGTGSFSVTAINSVFVNADFHTNGTGSFFYNCSFLGATTTFEDANNSAYYEVLGGYYSSNLTINGGAELYLSGLQCDAAFGAAITAVATANGTPLIQTDSGSVPATIAGAFTLKLTSYARYVTYTPTAPANWAAVPARVIDALDALALASNVASASKTGVLNSADWTTFNAKQAAGNYLTALTGDVTAAGPGSGASTIVDAAVQRIIKNNVTAKALYVSTDVGNDTTGDGSFAKPFKTIQKGIDVAAAIPATANNPISVSVSPGTYNENISVTQQGIALKADAPLGRADLVTITGTITINLTGAATGTVASLNSFYMYGFTIAPSGATKAVNFTGSVYQRLFISNCLIGQNQTDSAISHSNTGTSAGSFSTITARECDFKNNSPTNATIAHSAGKMFIAGANPSVSNSTSGGPAFILSGDANVNLTLNNGSVTGTYANSGLGSSTFSNTAFSAATSGAVITLSSTGTITLGECSLANSTSTGSGFSTATGSTVTAVGNLFNIGTGIGAYVSKGTGIFSHSSNTYASNNKLQNTQTNVALTTTPTLVA